MSARRPLALAALTAVSMGGQPANGQSRPDHERVHAESPPVWFEAHRLGAIVSPDGRIAVLPIRWPAGVRVVKLRTDQAPGDAIWSGLDVVQAAGFSGDGRIMLYGQRGGTRGWFEPGRAGPRALPIPADAAPVWSPDNRLAFFRRGAATAGIVVQDSGRARSFSARGRVTGLSWHPNGTILVMASDDRGVSTLRQIDPGSGRTITVADSLDADPVFSPLAVAPDGRRAFVALASARAVPPQERHRPDVDRDLDIYEIALSGGERRPVVATPAEESAPAIAGGQLYWTHTETETDAVILPASGGEARVVGRGAMHPSWRPDGRAIGVFYGGFRAVDWVLNWEGGVVGLDGAGRAQSGVEPMIVGWHEDFEPVWSPDGRWIAYHSHRSSAPVVRYETPETTDDIYLRRPGGGDEMRITTDGWEVGSPEWARDGTRLLYTGWERGEPRRTYAAIVQIDTANGRVTGRSRVPLGPIPTAEMVAWSPVSDEIAIEAAAAPGRHALWVVRPDGSGARKLTDYAMFTYGGVSWTRDGGALIYSALVNGRMQLFSIAATGGPPRQLTRDSANLLHPRVSPDGRFTAASRIVHRKEIRRMPLPSRTDAAADDTAGVRRALDGQRAAFERAIAVNDAAAMAATYAPHALLFPPSGDTIRGREAIRRAFDRTRDYTIRHDVVELDVRTETAFEMGRWTQIGKQDGTVKGGGWYFWVWRRQPNGSWLIDREIWNSQPPGG